jgi:hypothetical protein
VEERDDEVRFHVASNADLEVVKRIILRRATGKSG